MRMVTLGGVVVSCFLGGVGQLVRTTTLLLILLLRESYRGALASQAGTGTHDGRHWQGQGRVKFSETHSRTTFYKQPM
jgi:hypothetical protein